MRAQSTFLILLGAGIAAIVAGRLWTRVNWRSDLPPYGRDTRSSDLLLHPDRYVNAPSVGVIRLFNLAGAVFVAGAVCVLVYEALR